MEIIQIQNLVQGLLERSGSNAEVKLESFFPGNRFAGGKYSTGTHTVTLYMEEIKAQCLQLFSTLELLADYVMVVFAHELGHAEDAELKTLIEISDQSSNDLAKNTIALKIEQNAWDYARRLLPEINHTFMEKIIRHSLNPYHEALGMEQIA
ncbi:hypothetical protein [Bacillus sp. T33-2]|uniref:hypothetical protein n=1 Tax=Bacillus sp. T33-2 TaxID=2054168 RepID=UPI000C773C4D|nr:hypothetical protein [Bacillus sp. T33-2]PLR92656.1 hypothetical protein CVD19_20590 [Bacillus sp. T33-2]